MEYLCNNVIPVGDTLPVPISDLYFLHWGYYSIEFRCYCINKWSYREIGPLQLKQHFPYRDNIFFDREIHPIALYVATGEPVVQIEEYTDHFHSPFSFTSKHVHEYDARMDFHNINSDIRRIFATHLPFLPSITLPEAVQPCYCVSPLCDSYEETPTGIRHIASGEIYHRTPLLLRGDTKAILIRVPGTKPVLFEHYVPDMVI